MATIRTILLDLDGTLVDSSAPIVDGVIELAGLDGLRVPDRAWLRGRIGYSPEETWRMLGAADPAAQVARFRAWMRTERATAIRDGTVAKEGAREVLATLAGRSIRMAVATTRETDSALESLEATGLSGYVPIVVGGDRVAAPKPAPDVIHACLDALGATPEGALMVGDTDADVGAARAAGIPCWSVLGGTGDVASLRAAGTDRILEDGIRGLPAALLAASRRPAP